MVGVHIVRAWWRHQMETFSALLAICAGNSPAPVNSPHKGQWRAALMFSLIWVWINSWVNNREAGDLRLYRVHCDVIVMDLTGVPMHHPSFWQVSHLPGSTIVHMQLCMKFKDFASRASYLHPHCTRIISGCVVYLFRKLGWNWASQSHMSYHLTHRRKSWSCF